MDGQQGGLQFGGGRSIIIPLQNALCSTDKASACVERQPSPTTAIGISLPNQQAPARDREPTSKSCTKERGTPQGTDPSHWPCSVFHLSVQRQSPSEIALCSPFSTHLWPESGLCPSRDCSVTLPGPPFCNTIVTWPGP